MNGYYDPISGEFVSVGAYPAFGYSGAEMIGADVDDDLADLFSGPPPRMMRRPMNLPQQMADARDVDPHAVLVRSQQDRRRRILDLGIPETVIAANQTALIEIRPQRVFRTEKLAFPNGIASSLTLVSASVGQNSQLAGGGPVPLETFANNAFNTRERLWDTASPGINVQLNIRNDTGAPVTARGTLIGTATVR